MKQYQVTHTTRYRYSLPVSLCHNEAFLVPRDDRHQQCVSTQLQIDPTPAVQQARKDFFGNIGVYFAIQRAHTTLQVTAASVVEVSPPPKSDAPEHGIPWEEARQRFLNDPLARPFILDSQQISVHPRWAKYARGSFRPGRPLVEAADDLMRRIHADFAYEPGFTTVSTPVEAVYEHRRGVCQDFAHFAIACLRSLGLAARYVSGYLQTQPPPGRARLVGADASHAWFSVLVPDGGWIDFDPTNNLRPAEQHVTLAWARDYSDIPPLRGVIIGGGANTMEVAVDVLPLAGTAQPADQAAPNEPITTEPITTEPITTEPITTEPSTTATTTESGPVSSVPLKAGEVEAGEVEAGEVEAGEVAVDQVGPDQVGPDQVGRGEVQPGAAHIGAGHSGAIPPKVPHQPPQPGPQGLPTEGQLFERPTTDERP